MLKKFIIWLGLGLGLTLGGGLIYAFYVSEAMRLLAVGVLAFVLAAATIGGTALLVNRQWTKALGSQTHRTTHNHRYPPYNNTLPPARQWSEMLPPPLPTLEMEAGQDIDDEVVA